MLAFIGFLVGTLVRIRSMGTTVRICLMRTNLHTAMSKATTLGSLP